MILTWNDGPLLSKAIASALGSVGIGVGVVVVDNGSAPPAVVPDDTRVRLLRLERNLGVATGRTLGVAASEADLLCFLDSDAELRPDTLRRLSDVLRADPSVGLVAPVFDGQAPAESGGRAPSLGTKLARALNLRHAYAPSGVADGSLLDVDFAIGACQLFRRAAWQDVAGLDTTYFYGPEDVDFCLRLRESGHRVVQALDVRCHHPARRRFKKLLTRQGLRHGLAVARHLWRHRHYRPQVP